MALNFLNNGYFAGKVGIGTETPTYQLSVVGSIQSDFFRGYTYPTNSFLDFDDDQTAGANHTRLASIGRIAYLADTNANEPPANPAHEFFTGTSDIDTATSLMIIETSGNVGIGTTSPGAKLEVNSDGFPQVRIHDEATGGEAGIRFKSFTAAANDLHGDIFVEHSSGNETGRMGFRVPFTNERLTILSTGNVGIGTTSPDAKLHIEDTSGANIILNSATGAVKSGIYLTEGATSAPKQVGAYLSYDGSSNKFSIATGVGVPADKLTIARDTGLLQLNSYGAGTLVSDASGNITVSSGGGAGGPYLPLAGGTMSGAIVMNNNDISGVRDLGVNSELAVGIAVASKTFNYGSEFTANGASLQFVYGRTGSATGKGAIGADQDSIFSVWNVDSGAAERFRMAKDGAANFTNSLYIPDYIYHVSDTNTFFGFPSTDNFKVAAGGNDNFAVNATTVFLKHTGNTKLITTTAGVTVTGGWVTDGVSVATANVEHTDNTKALFGNGNDLEIYHSGTHSFIDGSNGAGSLYIRPGSGGTIQLETTTGTDMIVGASSAVTLYSSGNSKLSTGAVGVGTATTAGGTLIDGWITTTQANAIDNTTIATTAYVNNKIALIPAGLVFQGTWNASTNTPTLTSGSGTTGNFYIVSVAGSTNLDGITDWKVGDWAVFIEQGASDQWEKIDNSSVLDGIGTGQTLPLWAGSGTSNTLTNSRFTQTSTANIITGPGNAGSDKSLSVTSAGNTEQLYIQGTGEVVVSQNYFYVAASQGMYSNGLARLRGGVTDDQGTLNLGGNGSAGNLTLTSNTSATFAGDVKWSGGVGRLVSNQLQSGYNQNADNTDFWINYTGYQGGSTYFRDFRIGDGKQNQIAFFDGSTKNATFAGGATFVEDVLVGKTSNTIATAGAKIGATTGTNITRDSNEVLYLNRTTNFGKTLSIAKDGTTIGEIGTYSGVPYIGYSQGGGGGIMFNGLSIEPTAVGASRTSNTNDIGSTNYKWKNGWFGSTLQSNIIKLDSGLVELTSQSTTKLWLTTNQVQLYAGGLLVFGGYNSSNDGVVVGNETGDINVTLAGGANDKVLYLEGSSGNVGIGTKTPGEKLEIAGSLLLANNNDIKFNNSAGNKISAIRYNSSNQLIIANGNSPNGDIHFQSDVTSGLMMILDGATDYVGIGDNTSPKSMLDVQGGIKMADDTDTASADKVGTMRYRTGTEYVEDTGIQLLLNNNFDTDTVWSKGTGWAISGGTANATASTAYLSQNPFNPSTATYYQITWTISNYSAGTYRFYMRGNVSADFGTSTYVGNGTFTHVMQSGSGGASGFLFDARGALTASVDNIILTEVSVEQASYADMCMQTGSSTYEWVNIVRNTY